MADYLARMLRTDFTHIPQLTTRHLLLRGLEESDASAVFSLRSNPAVMRFIPKPLNSRVDESLQMIREFQRAAGQGDAIMWGIVVKGTKAVVGYIGFWRMIKEEDRAEIGYALHPDLWGQGLMTEALEITLRHGFRTMGLREVEAQVTPANAASIQVLQRNHFSMERRILNTAADGTGTEAIVYVRKAPARNRSDVQSRGDQ
jgi:ribosomal-protein-alanine N-acetyltransferase